MWILLAFASAFFAGVTAILAKVGIKGTDSNVATAIRTIVILLFAWLMVLVTGAEKTITDISGRSYAFILLSGMATGFSWLCYFRALQLGDVNKVVPIDKSSTILTMLLAFVLLGKAITWPMGMGMLCMGIGTWLMIQKQPEAQAIEAKKDGRWLLYAAGSALFASLTAIFAKIGMQDVDSNVATAMRTVVVLAMAWGIVFLQKKQGEVKKIDRKSMVFLVLSGMTTGLSWLCYYRALQEGPASVVVPVDKLSMLVAIGFSYFVLKEKLTRRAALGLVLVTAGTLLLLV